MADRVHRVHRARRGPAGPTERARRTPASRRAFGAMGVPRRTSSPDVGARSAPASAPAPTCPSRSRPPPPSTWPARRSRLTSSTARTILFAPSTWPGDSHLEVPRQAAALQLRSTASASSRPGVAHAIAPSIATRHRVTRRDSSTGTADAGVAVVQPARHVAIVLAIDLDEAADVVAQRSIA